MCLQSEVVHAQYSIYSGAYINFFVKWEGFVQDFLDETFRKMVECITSKEHPPQEAAKLLSKAFEQWKPESESEQSLSVQLLLNPEKWREILRDFSDNVLQGCMQTPFRSLGYNVHTPDISTYFQNLFDCNVSLAESLLESSNSFRLHYLSFRKIEKDGKFPLIITEAAALKTLVRLLYGVRCMLAHTNHSKTFGKTGALYDFPKVERFKELMGESNPEACSRSVLQLVQ